MELRPYQQIGVDFLTSANRCILADEMGVGKTPQLIMAAQGKTLVIAPPGLHLNWQREVNAWKPGPDGDDFYIASYHSLIDSKVKDGRGHVAGKAKARFLRDWDTLICDEAHHLKGRNTGYAKATVNALAPRAGQLFLGTGTPVKNWAHELFMLLRAIYPKDPRFSSFWRWADQWFTVYEDTVFRGKRQPLTVQKVGNLRSITTWEQFVAGNGLTDRWLRREIDDPEIGLDIPEMQVIKIPVKMTQRQNSAYRDMERDFFAKVDDDELLSETTGGQWQEMHRITSGLNFHPDLAASGDNAKMSALNELLDNLSNDQLVIFCHYRHSVEKMVDLLRKRKFQVDGVHGGQTEKRNDTNILHHQVNKTQILVGTYGSMREGHNLHHASKMVLFETYPVPADIDQAIGRIRRFGQKKRCTVWHLYVADTVDSYYVEEMIPAKRVHSEGVYTAADYRKHVSE